MLNPRTSLYEKLLARNFKLSRAVVKSSTVPLIESCNRPRSHSTIAGSAPVDSPGSGGLSWTTCRGLSRAGGEEGGPGRRRGNPLVELDSEGGGQNFLRPHQ